MTDNYTPKKTRRRTGELITNIGICAFVIALPLALSSKVEPRPWTIELEEGKTLSYSGMTLGRYLFQGNENTTTLTLGQRALTREKFVLATASTMKNPVHLYIEAANVRSFDEFVDHIRKICEVADKKHFFNIGVPGALDTIISVNNSSCIANKPG